MAPGLGLYLDEVFFEAYNTKQEAELLFESKQKSKKSSSASTSAKTEGEGEGGGEGEEKVSPIPSGPTSFQRVDYGIISFSQSLSFHHSFHVYCRPWVRC
jgi:hypothetical protein